MSPLNEVVERIKILSLDNIEIDSGNLQTSKPGFWLRLRTSILERLVTDVGKSPEKKLLERSRERREYRRGEKSGKVPVRLE